MIKIDEIKIILTKRETLLLGVIFFGILIVNILDELSFAIIFPIYKIIFLNEEF